MEMTIGTGPAPVEVEITPAEYSVELEAKETFIKGDKGDDGYTPIKGIDYFDGKDGYTPIKGVDYFDGVDGQNGRDGQDGYTPRKGIDYFDGQNGKDGYTPVKGVDYFDGQNGKDGKDGKDYVITTSDYQNIAKLVPVPSIGSISETDINNICKPAFKGYTITFLSGSYENEKLVIGLIDGTQITKTKSSDYVGKVEKVEWIACQSSEVSFDKTYTFYRETWSRYEDKDRFMGGSASDRLFLTTDININGIMGD